MEMVKQDNRRQLSARVCKKLDVLKCCVLFILHDHITIHRCMLDIFLPNLQNGFLLKH